MNKSIYAKLTNNCNLQCPHCDIRNNNDNFDHDKFINILREFDGRIVFFGGEPAMYPDRLIEVARDHIISEKDRSISTNLITLNDELIKLYKDIGSIATSWNPNRFNDKQYKVWKDNINWLETENIKALLMITLTDDLISISPKDFMEIAREWNTNVFKALKFEQLVSNNNTPEFFDRVDDWLCDVYKAWNIDIYNRTIDAVNNWYYDCSEIYTLEPNGELKTGCPHSSTINIPDECYICDNANRCKPCQLQRYCSYPKKFAKLVRDNK